MYSRSVLPEVFRRHNGGQYASTSSVQPRRRGHSLRHYGERHRYSSVPMMEHSPCYDYAEDGGHSTRSNGRYHLSDGAYYDSSIDPSSIGVWHDNRRQVSYGSGLVHSVPPPSLDDYVEDGGYSTRSIGRYHSSLSLIHI